MAVSYGVRFSAHNYGQELHINSYPLYAAAKLLFDSSEIMREAMTYLKDKKL